MIKRNAKLQQQEGALTLFVGLILTLLASLTMYYVSSESIRELRMSFNEVKSKRSMEAAQAGISHGVGYFAKNGSKVRTPTSPEVWDFTPVDSNADKVVDHFTFGGAQFATLTDNRGFYAIRYCPIGAVMPQCPTTPGPLADCGTFDTNSSRQPAIVACGWSDNTASPSVRRIIQFASGTPSLPGKVTSPLVTQAGTNLANGNASIWNYFNDMTIWSGADMTLKNSTNKTFIKDQKLNATLPDDWRDGKFNGNAIPAGWMSSSSGTQIGHDVIVNDPSLANMSDPAFFARFMGSDLQTYVNNTATYKIDLGISGTTSAAGKGLSKFDATDLSKLSEHSEGEVIYVRGDMDLTSLGTTADPVILIVDGNLNLNGTPRFNGLIFVTGKTVGAGGGDIFGALLSKDMDVNGNPNLIYDPDALAKASVLGRGALVPGGWADW